jgi:N-acetylneuraminic acid mutarotase
MPNGARTGLASAVVSGKIYVIGGYFVGAEEQVFNIVEEYDPDTDTWTTKSPMPTPRCWLTACVVEDKIYAIGGTLDFQPVSDVEEYDPATDTWTKKSDMPTARWGLSSNTVDGIIYTIGGSVITSSPWGPGLSTVEAYDPKLDTFVDRNRPGPTTPSEYRLKQNYPNPFNPTTTIEYEVAKAGQVRLAVFDVLGRHIKTLVKC